MRFHSPLSLVLFVLMIMLGACAACTLACLEYTDRQRPAPPISRPHRTRPST